MRALAKLVARQMGLVGGARSASQRRGDSAWGYRMQALRAAAARHKRYNRLHCTTTFPFRELPDSENP